MKKSVFLTVILFVLSVLQGYAQIKDVFTFNKSGVVTNSYFMDNPNDLYKVEDECYTIKKSYVEKYNGAEYTIDLLYFSDESNETFYYDAIVIKRKSDNKVILKTGGTYGTMYFNIENLTAWQSKAPYLMLPLDDESFALFFAGLLYTGDEAPEMMIIVVRGNEAKVVFDKKAYVYKYTPYPNYSAEYVEDIEWFMTQPDVMPPASVFNKLKRFKIWQEGNILKYKPLN